MIRKLHLDYHTPPYMPGVGGKFDAEQFAATLADAKINAAALFAKDDYGLCYFPTKIGRVHPNLQAPNMLGQMARACTARGIDVQAYFCLGLSLEDLKENPQWRQRLASGMDMTWGPDKPLVEFAGDYVDKVVLGELDEVLDAAPQITGFWFDICLYLSGAFYSEAFDAYARAHGRAEATLGERRDLATQILDETAAKINAHIARRRKDARNYFNTLVTPGGATRTRHLCATELEAPPFFVHNDFMPVHLRHFRTLSVPAIGLTSRFQYPWTDIGSLRTHDQLLFDAACIVSAGAGVSIGDHLHPSARPEPLVYQRIGQVYRYLESLEPWIDATRPLAEAAVITDFDLPADATMGTVPPAARCATRMLCELGVQCDVIGLDAPLDRYGLVVWPAQQAADEALAKRLRAHVARGGAIVATGPAWRGLQDIFGLADVHEGSRPIEGGIFGDFFRPTAQMTLEPWAQVSPGRMWVCTPAAGGTELAQRVLPLVPGRSPEPLGCTPPGPGDVVEGSAIVAAGRCVYSGVPLFDNFQAHGNAVFRDWVWALLDRVLPQRLVRHDGGPNVEVTLHAGKGLHVAHLVQWASERWPTRHMYPAQAPRLAGVNLQLRLPRPARVMSLPDQSPLAFTYKDGVLSLRSPSFTVHQAIAIET